MYILIDKTNATLVGKHEDLQTLSHLADIEYPDVDVMLVPLFCENGLHEEDYFFLTKLHKNLTGSIPDQLSTKTDIFEKIMYLAETIQVSDVVQSEVAKQAGSVEGKSPYLYHKGSNLPIAGKNKSTLKCKAIQGKLKYTRHEQLPIFNKEPVSMQTEKVGTRVRASNVKDQIWATAGEMWERAGKPVNQQEVLRLRKLIMVELESKFSIKKTTSSNVLGEWQKDQIKA